MILRPTVKIHGGKRYLSGWIIDHLPKTSDIYAEPFSGAASVLSNREPSKKEYLNDLDEGIISILITLRDNPKRFINALSKLKYEEDTFEKAKQANPKNMFEKAVNEYVIRRMSRGGLRKSFAWSDRQRGGKPGDVNAFETMLDVLPLISKRLQGVEISQMDAIDFIQKIDSKDTLFYIDPPYLPVTRKSIQVYEHEMTEGDHIKLAEVLNNTKGQVVLSGYPSGLYDSLYKDWNVFQRQVANHSSQKKIKTYKTETLWTNFVK